MSNNLLASTVVGVPIVNEATSDGVITLLDLEEAVILGMTYGAWFKVGMFLALILLIIERVLTIKSKLKSKD